MQKHIKTAVWGLLLSGALLTTGNLQAKQDAAGHAPDNTAVNKRDRNQGEPTADQAKNGKSDRETMRQIRRDIVKDKSLSTYAHNVKIISQGGKVTLKGPVRSEEEKNTIEQTAKKVAGDGNVDNQLTVAADNK